MTNTRSRRTTLLVAGALTATAGIASAWHLSHPSRDDRGAQRRGAPVASRDAGARDPSTAPRAQRLVAFGSEAAVRAYVDAVLEAQRRANRGRARLAAGAVGSNAAAAPAQAAQAQGEAGGAESSITNNQVQGVDEGDIVKAHGDHLVVLRRGRLFTVRVGDGALTPVSMVDAFAPGAQPASWYDEMLVHGDTIIVVGYDYRSGGTELDTFDIDAAGRLTYRDTMWVRSGDYYSSRNYASRVVGNQLVMYMPVPLLSGRVGDGQLNLPAVRRTRDGAWTTVADFAHLYRPLGDAGAYPLVHTVMFCDLTTRLRSCRAEGIVGSYGRTFYVSQTGVYVWTQGAVEADETQAQGAVLASPRGPRARSAAVYRFPLDGGAPGAVRAQGAPVDQFSFQESRGELRVLVRADGNGDAMWSPEVTAGDAALLRVPLARFDAEVARVPAAAYTRLASPGRGWALQNRFVGDHLLYGTGQTWHRSANAPAQNVYVHAIARGETTTIELPHGVDRIEALGSDAVVIGSGGRDLHFTSIALGDRPAAADRYTRAGASEGETRSHGFFFRQEGPRAGVLGLPIRGAEGQGYHQLHHGSASVAFLRVDGLRFTPIGSLESARGEAAAVDDRCVASCADWYGNARPIFYRGRVFALMGYELVEGRANDGVVREASRTDYYRALARQDVRDVRVGAAEGAAN